MNVALKSYKEWKQKYEAWLRHIDPKGTYRYNRKKKGCKILAIRRLDRRRLNLTPTALKEWKQKYEAWLRKLDHTGKDTFNKKGISFSALKRLSIRQHRLDNAKSSYIKTLIATGKEPSYTQPIKKLKITRDAFLLDFFKSYMLPVYLQKRFDVNLKRKKYFKNWILTTHNIKVIWRVFRLYSLLFLAMRSLLKKRWKKARVLSNAFRKKKENIKLFHWSIFNYFNNSYIQKYYFNNIYIQKITKSYMLDITSNMTFINSYNFYVISQLKIFEVILNFENYKYEEDKFLYKIHKYGEEVILHQKLMARTKQIIWRYKKMHTDFFDYIPKKNRKRFVTKVLKRIKWIYHGSWNVVVRGEDDEVKINQIKFLNNIKNHIGYHSNLFFGYIIHDLALNLILTINNKIKLLLNYFNFNFFDKIALYLDDKKYLGEHNLTTYPNVLTSLYYGYNQKNKKVNKLINKNKVSKTLLYTDYKKLVEEPNEVFNPKHHILDIKHYGLKIPFLFFFLYTTYSLFYRRARYNFYIRGHSFFNEHFSKIQYFNWVYNHLSVWKIRAPVTNWQVQKLFTIYHFKGYVEMATLNDWFYLYKASNTKLTSYVHLDNVQHKYNINLLLNSNYVWQTLNVKNKNLQSNNKYAFFNRLFYNNIAKIWHYRYTLYICYKFFMETAIMRSEPAFKLGLRSYKRLIPMIKRVYTTPYDQLAVTYYLRRQFLWEHYFNMYLNLNCLNIYFLKDFFNLNNYVEYLKYFKILNFYEKIFYIILLLLDTYFQHFYWNKCFPRNLKSLKRLSAFLFSYMVLMRFNVSSKSTIKRMLLNVPKYDFFMHYLNWKMDTGNYHISNKANTDTMALDYIIINVMYKQRFIELICQLKFLLKKITRFKINNSVSDEYHERLVLYRSVYFDLLINNIEYILILFFINKSKFLDILKTKLHNRFIKFIYSNYIYRYYIYSILLESHYYDDWFHNKKKRIYWSFKKFVDHEGIRFYKEKNEIM